MKKILVKRLNVKKRIFAFLLTLIMILTAAPLPHVLAVEAEAENIDTGYSSTLSAVLRRANAGDTVRLLGDVSTSSTLSISKAITLDGKGFSVNYSGASAALSVTADVILSDISVYAEQGNGCDLAANASLTMNNAKIEAGLSYAVTVKGENAAVTVNSGGLKAPFYLVYAPSAASPTVKIYGGSFETTAESDGVRMFQMTSGSWDFYGGRYEAKRGYVFNASAAPVMNVYGGSYVFTGASENLWNIRDNSVANFYGGYFYAPNHGSPFLVRGEKNATMNVYGGSYFAADTTPFSSSGTGTLNEYGGSFYDIRYGIEVERFERIGNVTTQRFNIKPTRLTGAAVRIDGEDASIGFMSVVTRKIRENLSGIADDGSELSYGTLLIESEKLSGTVGFTHDILEHKGFISGKDYLDVPATKITELEDGSLKFGACVPNLTPEDYATDFSAVAYIKFKVNGNDCYSYSIFSDGDTRNIRDVARRALADNDEHGEMIYTPEEVAVLEKYISDTYEHTADETMTAKVLSLNILTHNLAGRESKYKLYGNQVPENYDFGKRYNYVKALFEYTSPDVALFQEYSGRDFWGQAITLNTTEISGVYTSPDFPGYTWVNHGNRRGVLYENNTIENMGKDPFHAHNFVLFSSDKFEYLASATRFVSKTGTREVTGGNLGDNPGGGSYNDLGDYTWVALRDKATGIVSIYASTHTYNGDLQRYPYMLDNIQCMTEELQRVSTELFDGAPVILGGDFNMRNENYLFHASYDHLTAVANYTDSKITGDNCGTARVYGNNINGEEGSSRFYARIDYIFANGAEPFAYEVLDGQVEKRGEAYEYVKDPSLDGSGYDISDHLPLMTQVLIGKTEDYKYKTANPDEFYKNPATAEDVISSASGSSASTKASLKFDSTALLEYFKDNGQYMEAKIVEDAERGKILRIAATDETNYVNVAFNYKEMFGSVNASGYSTVTVKYKTVLIIKNFGGANDIKFGISTGSAALKNGTLAALDTSNGGDWKTLTVDISSLSGNINELGIYGRSKLTGLFTGDAVYIESITFTN